MWHAFVWVSIDSSVSQYFIECLRAVTAAYQVFPCTFLQTEILASCSLFSVTSAWWWESMGIKDQYSNLDLGLVFDWTILTNTQTMAGLVACLGYLSCWKNILQTVTTYFVVVMPLNPHQLCCPCWTKEAPQHAASIQRGAFRMFIFITQIILNEGQIVAVFTVPYIWQTSKKKFCIRLSPSTSIVILVSSLSCESLQLIESCYGPQDCLVLSLLLSLGGWLCLKLCAIISIVSDDVLNSAL